MNTKAIREALELAKAYLWSEHVSRRVTSEESIAGLAMRRIEWLAGQGLQDCRAFVAVCKAIEELDGEEAKP